MKPLNSSEYGYKSSTRFCMPPCGVRNIYATGNILELPCWMCHLQSKSRVLGPHPPLISSSCVELLKNHQQQQQQESEIQVQYLRLWSYPMAVYSLRQRRKTPSDIILYFNQRGDIKAHAELCDIRWYILLQLLCIWMKCHHKLCHRFIGIFRVT